MRSITAARSALPDTTSQSSCASASNNLESNQRSSPLKSIMNSGGNANPSISEDDGGQGASDEEEEDRPMSIADLQRKAAQSIGALHINPRQSMRFKNLPGKKPKK